MCHQFFFLFLPTFCLAEKKSKPAKNINEKKHCLLKMKNEMKRSERKKNLNELVHIGTVIDRISFLLFD